MVDELRAMVTGLSQRVESLERSRESADNAALDRRLNAGSLATGTSGVPDAIADGASVLDRLARDSAFGGYAGGRIDPFFGRANVLRDPTLEQLVDLTTGIGTTATSLGRWWDAAATFTGAGSPFCDVQAAVSDRITGAARGSSSPLAVQFGWGVTGSPVTMEATVMPNATMAVNEAPWLVAAVRARWDADSIVASALTGTVKLVILDNSDVVIAESDAAPLEGGEGFVDALLQCAYAGPTDGGLYRPQAIIEVAAASIGGVTTDAITLVDWQFHESETEDPPSFTPAVGSWIPNAVSSYGAPASPFIEGSDSTTGEIRFEVYPDGRMVWYDDGGVEIAAQDPAGGQSVFGRTLDAAVESNDGSTPSDWLTFPVVDGRSYGIHVQGSYFVANVGQALQVGTLIPGGRIVGIWQTFGNGSASSAYNDAVDSTSTSTVLTGNSTTDAASGSNNRPFRFDGTYQCTADGTFRFRFRRGGANTTSPGVTIRSGSSAIITTSTP